MTDQQIAAARLLARFVTRHGRTAPPKELRKACGALVQLLPGVEGEMANHVSFLAGQLEDHSNLLAGLARKKGGAR